MNHDRNRRVETKLLPSQDVVAIGVERVLRDQASLDATYTREDTGESMTGHWIAFHLLEHDIHHRSDIFHYLALLEIEHPEVDTP